ncbi:MAG: A/G-specific adenine glycosylase [Gemmatimonadota bacterium]
METAAARDLLTWFGARSRDVPWRGDPDPYRVWVCEVMAQQTRIGTVRERIPSFFESYPTLESLAAADPDELMRAWEGLGYYARARNLRRAAARLVERAGAAGEAAALPSHASELRELPGIGPYTAGAVASIAFGRAEPAVDGNARRVLSRLFDLERPTPAVLDERARRLIHAADAADAADDGHGSRPAGENGKERARERPSLAGALNQAIMDLGGEVCTPRSPSCPACPLSKHCVALASGTVAERPPRRSRQRIPHHDIGVALVWRDDGRLYIQRRPDEGLLGGLWEFPGGKVECGESPAEAAERETLEETGLRVGMGGSAGRVEHAYSHFRITLHAFHARVTGGRLRTDREEPHVWVEPDELDAYAFPAANRRILEGLEGLPPKPTR